MNPFHISSLIRIETGLLCFPLSGLESGVLGRPPTCLVNVLEERQAYFMSVAELTVERLTIRARHKRMTFQVIGDYGVYPTLGSVASTIAIYPLTGHGQSHKDWQCPSTQRRIDAAPGLIGRCLSEGGKLLQILKEVHRLTTKYWRCRPWWVLQTE